MINQIEAEKLGAFAQRLEFTGAVELVVSSGTGVVIDEVAGKHAVDQHGELAGSGGNRLGLAGAGGEASIEGAKSGRSATETHCTTAQNDRGAVGRWWGPGGEQTSAGNLVVGREREPGSKVGGGGPALHIGADLGNDLQRGVGADAVNLA